MGRIFRRELASYAASHRDPINGLMHQIGNPILFVAVILPLTLVPVEVWGLQVSIAPVLMLPALVLWLALDIGIGLTIALISVPLVAVATAISANVSLSWLWTIAAGLFVVGWALQIVGHQVFERKRPSLLDNPLHMMISPMYIFAKMFARLGIRPDLAAILARPGRAAPDGSIHSLKESRVGAVQKS